MFRLFNEREIGQSTKSGRRLISICTIVRLKFDGSPRQSARFFLGSSERLVEGSRREVFSGWNPRMDDLMNSDNGRDEVRVATPSGCESVELSGSILDLKRPRHESLESVPVPVDPFIPIRTGDLTRLLFDDPASTAFERSKLNAFARLLANILHYQSFTGLKRLQELYAPLDPDSDCLFIQDESTVLTEDSDEAFLAPFERILLRGNFRPLHIDEIRDAIQAPNEMGLNYVPNLGLFEHLRVYVRGRTPVTRIVRNLGTRFRRRAVVLDGYQRVVVMLKFKKGLDFGPYARSDALYLRLFKDVPRVDMEMHLPEQGTKVRMRWVDRAQIASPLVVGFPTLLFKLFFASIVSPMLLAGVIVGPISAGINSFFGFQRAKQRHLSLLIRHLYYLNLANNGSVINRVVGAAEDEDYKESLIAYYFLRRHHLENHSSRTTPLVLRDRVRAYLKTKLDLCVDFEVEDALRKLCELGLVKIDAATGEIESISLDQALIRLREVWTGFHPETPCRPIDES